ncbi:MAG: YihY/virulence factor BrkB family protein [Anaerolineae bacterium]|nr:YihY/virulence factor BrkB family protein [Anaerolineae bacterium]
MKVQVKNKMGNLRKNSAGKIKSLYNWANGLTGGSLSVFNDAVQHFVGARAAEASASIAYYAIFSLFPLLIILVVVGSFVLESEDVQRWVLDFEAQVIPVSHQLIEKNIQRIFELRGTVGFVALVGLSWSATSVLAVLVRNINCAWTEAEPRNFLESRLMALGIVGGLVVLLFLSSVLTTVLGTLARFSVPLWGGFSMQETLLWTILSSVLPRLTAFLALLGFYCWVPNVKVKWSEASWGASVAILAWEIATRGFTWYLSSGIVQYELVYGSLGTVVVLMLWMYIGVLITLFGAHLGAAIARRAG